MLNKYLQLINIFTIFYIELYFNYIKFIKVFLNEIVNTTYATIILASLKKNVVYPIVKLKT